MKYTVTKKYAFDSAHRLMGHKGKCRYLHGHRYTADITLEADTLNHLGMVYDFGDVSKLIGSWIDTHWDHNTILRIDDLMVDYLEPEQCIYTMDDNPTAECMAKELYKKTVQLLNATGVMVKVQSITIWETPGSFATYSGE